MKFSTYLYQILGLSFILIVLILALGSTILADYYLIIHPWMVGIFALITGTEHYFLTKAVKNQPNRFSQVFMGASAIKLMALLFVTVIYLIVDKTQVIPFVVVLFVLYLIFTSFEVRALQKLVKGSS